MSLGEFLGIPKEGECQNLIFDISHLVYRTLFISAYKDEITEDFGLWKHTFLTSILYNIKMFNPSKVIFALDSKNNWRKEIYPLYKAHRAEARKKSAIDFDKFFPILDQFKKELREVFINFYFLEIPKTEADDVIAVLCKKCFVNDKTIIISSDRDLNQLLKENIKQYDPIKNSYVENINIKKDLEIKLLMGDKGDNIPPIYPRCGPVTAAKILNNNGLDKILLENDDTKKNYERNKMLIDFNNIPKIYMDKIEEEYKNYNIQKYNGKLLFEFFIKNKLSKLAEDLQTFSGILNKII